MRFLWSWHIEIICFFKANKWPASLWRKKRCKSAQKERKKRKRSAKALKGAQRSSKELKEQKELQEISWLQFQLKISKVILLVTLEPESTIKQEPLNTWTGRL